VSAPVPTSHHLRDLTEQVADNNFYSTKTKQKEQKAIEFLRGRIKHVIYVVKENRTFDQILGDLNNGANADRDLTQFGAEADAEPSQPLDQIRDARQLHEPW